MIDQPKWWVNLNEAIMSPVRKIMDPGWDSPYSLHEIKTNNKIMKKKKSKQTKT